MLMEKSRSYPEYSSGFGYDRRSTSTSTSYNFNGPRGNDGSSPEMKRKRRVAAYNVFTMEAKLKSSVRSSFKWIKNKFTDVRYGG